jgi:hypothetical protein
MICNKLKPEHNSHSTLETAVDENFGYGVTSSPGGQEKSYGKIPLGIQEKVSTLQDPDKLMVYHVP